MKKRASLARTSSAHIDELEQRTLFSVAYTLTEIVSSTSGVTTPAALNDAGQVVGTMSTYQNTSDHHAFSFLNGAVTALGTPASQYQTSTASGVNNAGEIVGSYAEDEGATALPYAYAGGTFTPLEAYGISTAAAVNNAGQITGALSNGFAYLLNAGSTTPTQLPTPANANAGSNGVAINNAGMVAGGSEAADSTDPSVIYASVGTVFTTESATDLPFATDRSYVYNTATAINDAGTYVGSYRTGTFASTQYTAYIASGATPTLLGTPGGHYSFASGINNAGDVVGYYTTTANAQRAYVYSGGAMTDLNTLIDPALGVTLTSAVDINNTGQITGLLTDSTGKSFGYLLTPTNGGNPGTPSPTTTLLPTVRSSTLPATAVLTQPARGVVSVTVTNSTNAVIQGIATATLYASTGSAIDASSVPLASLKRRVVLKAGRATPFVFKIKSLPAALAAGSYTLVAQTTDPSGNLTTSAPGPALTVQAAVVNPSVSIAAIAPAASRAGGLATIRCVVSNSGNVPAIGGMSIDVGYSTDGAAETASFLTTLRKVRIPAGKSIPLIIRFRLPRALAAGTYTPFVSITLDGITSSAVGSTSWTVS